MASRPVFGAADGASGLKAGAISLLKRVACRRRRLGLKLKLNRPRDGAALFAHDGSPGRRDRRIFPKFIAKSLFYVQSARRRGRGAALKNSRIAEAVRSPRLIYFILTIDYSIGENLRALAGSKITYMLICFLEPPSPAVTAPRGSWSDAPRSVDFFIK